MLRFAENLSDGGIKLLIKEGASCDMAGYNFLNTSTPAGLATISSGSNPSTHGIIGNQWFNYTTGERVELLKDNKTMTVGADNFDSQLSPAALYAGTIGDQIKGVSPYSKVVSVAFDPLSSVIMGGYRADAAYWVNHREGHFVSNNYYMEKLPDWVNNFNSQNVAQEYCKQKWSISKEASKYKNILRSDIIVEDQGGLLNIFQKDANAKWNFERLKYTPFANTLVRDFAIQAIIYEELGKDQSTDLLNVVFDGSRYVGEKYGTQSMEVEDCFYRMDAEIKGMMEYLSSQIGKEHLLVVLSSDHGASDPAVEGRRMPSGKFNAAQFSILINGFVGAKLGGDKRWVLDFINNQIYLDRRLIYQEGHDLEQIQNDIAAFAIQFRGVAQAITSTTLQRGQFLGGVMGQAQNSYFQRHSGDIMLNLLPGWIVEQSDVISDCGTAYNYDRQVPLVFWGGMISNKDISRSVDMSDVAATIAHIVGCAAPNAATGESIMEVYKDAE